MARRPTSPAGRRLFGTVFAAFAGIFILVGAGLAWRQGHRLAVSLPVDATVTDARVESHRGNKGGTQYKAVVAYHFTVDDRRYESMEPLPMSVSSGSSDDAQRIVSRFPPGTRTTAWYDPADPTSAFLLKEPSFFPYFFVLFPMLHVMVGLAMLLFADAPPERRPVRMAIIAAVWCVVGVFTALHYAAIGGAWTPLPLIALGVYGAIGLGLVAAWIAMAGKLARRRAAEPASDRRDFVDEPNPFRQS